MAGPPLPLNLTASYRNQQNQSLADSQNNAQQQQDLQNQKDVQNKFDAGNLSYFEYRTIFGKTLPANSRQGQLTYDYIDYLSAHNKPIPNAVINDLPESGRSFISYGAAKTNPKSQGGFSPVIPASIEQKQPAQSGEYLVASSSKAPNTFITNKGNLVQKQVSSPILSVSTPASSLENKNQYNLLNSKTVNAATQQSVPVSPDQSKITLFGYLNDLGTAADQEIGKIGATAGELILRGAKSDLTPYLGKNVEILNSSNAKASAREVGASLGLLGTYIYLPEYAVPRLVSKGASEFEEGKPIQGLVDVGTGILFKGAEKGAELGLTKLSENASKIRDIPYASGFADLTTGKFVSQAAGKTSGTILKAVPLIQKGIESGSTAYIGSQVAAQEIGIIQSINNKIPASTIRSESIQSAQNTGYFLIGYKLAGFSSKAAQPFYSTLKEGNGKKQIPYEFLQAPDVASGKTVYPKDTVNASAYLKSIEVSQNKAPYSKILNQKEPFGFNVSPGPLPKKYAVAAGSSELEGQYVNPKNASLVFGIPKSKEGIDGRLSYGVKLNPGAGTASVNVIGGKEFVLSEVNPRNSKSLENGAYGKFQIPTIDGKRTKSESEAILRTGTIVSQKKSNLYTIEKNLSKSRGYPFGFYLNVPEYSVSKIQQDFLKNEKKTTQITGKDLYDYKISKLGSNYYENYSESNPSVTRSGSSSILSKVISLPSNSPSSKGFSSNGISIVSYPSGSSKKSVSIGSSGNSFGASIRKGSASGISTGSSLITSSGSSKGNSISPSVGIGRGSSIRSPPGSPNYGGGSSVIFSPESKQNRKKKNLFGGFGVFTKVRGKERRVGPSFTQNDAFAYGTRLVKETLRASFRVKPIGGSAEPMGLNAANTPLYLSKKGFFVQKRGARLSARSEQREISLFKRQKKGGLF